MNQNDRVQQAADALAGVSGQSPVAAKRVLAEYDTRDLIASVAAEGVGGGSGVVQTATAILDNSQIIALKTTPVEVIPAPAATEVIVVLQGLITVDATAGAYGNITASGNVGTSSMSLVYGNDDAQASTYIDSSSLLSNGAAVTHSLITGSNVLVQGASLISFDITCVGSNVRLVAYNAAGNYDGGNAANSLKITVAYFVVDTT